MSKKPKPFIFRIRHEVEANRATVWLIRTDGAARAGLMHGVVGVEVAELVAELLEKAGAAVERITFEGTRHDEPRPETTEAEQQGLFSAME